MHHSCFCTQNVSVAIQLSTFISCTNQSYKKIIYIHTKIIEICIAIVNTWTVSKDVLCSAATAMSSVVELLMS